MIARFVRNTALASLLVLALSLIPTLLFAASGFDLELEPAPEDLDAGALARQAEDNMRSERTFIEAKMTVVSPRLSRPRVVAFHSWENTPGKKLLIRIDEPSKDK